MIRHTFRSILLDGKTDSGKFTTDMAAALFSEHITLLDFITVCCKGTTACPEGNKWPVMKKQLETHGTTFGLDDTDRMPFWWLVGSINLGFRALYFHAKSGGKPFTAMNASIRNMREGHNNQDGNILKSKVLVVYNGPHAQASQSSLANKALHPPAMIQMYTEHAAAFLKFLDGLVFRGEVEIKVPGVDSLLYYLRRAKMKGLTETPEEAAARREALLVLYAIPHLAAVLALALVDKDLSSLTIDTVINEETFSNPLDWKAYNELVSRLTKAEVVKKLKARREKQLSSVAGQLRHIAAVIAKGVDDISKLRSRALMSITFEGDDKKIFETLTAKFRPAELLRKLQDARKQWDESKLKEALDLSRIAAVVVSTGVDIFKLTSLKGVTFEGDDKKIFDALTTKFGSAELLKKLQDARKQWDEHALKESNDLKHIEAVLSDQYDISSLTTLEDISFEGNAAESIESLRSKYSAGMILEKVKDVHRKKGEETWKCTFDTSIDRKLGFFLSESEPEKDTLLVTEVDPKGWGMEKGLQEGDVVKSINESKWRGKGDYDRMIQLAMQAKSNKELVVLEVFGSKGRPAAVKRGRRKKQKTK